MASEEQERQMAELTLLSSMYPEEFRWQYPLEGAFDLSEAPTSEFQATIALEASYTLNVTLPPDYPSRSKPRIYLSYGADVDRATQQSARSQLRSVVESAEPGIECLDVIISHFAELLPALKEQSARETRQSGNPTISSGDEIPLRIKRVVIWSHHLLATSKRRLIVQWSRELRLGGYSRPGYPGAIFIEGEEDYVDEFVARIKELRWQALQVRASCICEGRACGVGQGVVELQGLGEVAEALEKNGDGTAEMFFEGMRIGKSS